MAVEQAPSFNRDFAATLWTRKWSIIAVTVVSLAVGLFVSLRQTPIYDSSTKIVVKPLGAPLQSGASSLVDMPTEQQIVSSDQVAALAVNKISPRPSIPELLDHLSVSSPASTDVLVIGYSDPRPLTAQQSAAAVADAYLEYKATQFRTSQQALQRPYVLEIARLTKQLNALNIRIQRAGGTPTPAQQAQQAQLNTQLAVARSQLVPIQAVPIDPGDVLQVANLPRSPSSPKIPLDAALALFVGAMLGVGSAFLRDRLDTKIRGQADLEARSGAPVLAIVPRARRWKKQDQAKLIVRDDRTGTVAEAYRLLRTGILFAATNRECQTILITSPSPGDGKTTVVANLGVLLTEAGKDVILISADLRKPRLHRFFGVRDRPGVVDVLAEIISLDNALIDPGMEKLRVLPGGAMQSLHAELLASDSMARLMKELRSRADFVIIDTPPVLAASDAVTLVPLADAVLLVVNARSSAEAVTQVVHQLDQVGAHVLGSVLNELDPKKARKGQYLYRYTYEYARPAREASTNGWGLASERAQEPIQDRKA